MQLNKDSKEWKVRHNCWLITQNKELWDAMKQQMQQDALGDLDPITNLESIIAMMNRAAQIDYVNYHIAKVERLAKEFETVEVFE